MVYQRIPAEDVDSSVLAERITFRNGKQAKNRFLKAAMTEKISSWSIDISRRGYPSERVINMYEKWGHGGFGVVLTGNVPVDPYHLESAGNSIICKENDSAELRELFSRWAKVTKADGALVVMQISHAGRQTPISVYENPFSASDVQLPGFGKPVPLTAEQIKKEVVDRFTYTAKVAYETGFDGVQLHGAHGYLLSQFMSPTTNKRTDKYGGSAENRVRIVMEIFDSIRKEIPAETGFIVGIKMNSVEFQEQGLETDDAKIMCQMMEDKGFDFVEMSGGTYEKLVFHHQRDSTKRREAFFLEFTDKLKPIFKQTPVFVTGGFRTVKGMVEAVKSGSTDGIGLGRPATAEPDLPKKVLSGAAKSAADSKFDPNDFGIAVMASNSQMALMGRRPLSDLNNNICEDIADFSRPEEAEEFKKSAAKYAEEMKETTEKNLPIFGVLEYTPRY